MPSSLLFVLVGLAFSLSLPSIFRLLIAPEIIYFFTFLPYSDYNDGNEEHTYSTILLTVLLVGEVSPHSCLLKKKFCSASAGKYEIGLLELSRLARWEAKVFG